MAVEYRGAFYVDEPMKIALRAQANGKLVAADDLLEATIEGSDATVSFPDERRPLVARSDVVGAWETFDLLAQDEHGNWVPFELPAKPLNPSPPTVPPWATFTGSAQDWFGQLVYGKPFGQATLLALEPTLNDNGWQLTPPNAAGDRTKVLPSLRGGSGDTWAWVRVGFGEGTWVWVVQP